MVYQGNIYVRCDKCCKRWFITFNGAECSGPMPIDAALWIRNRDEDNHRPGAIEGYCENIHKGRIRVAINIGNCPGRGDSDGYTGWNSVSRLIIEEVPKPQWLLSLVSCVSLCGNGSIIGCKWAKVVICKGFLPFLYNFSTCRLAIVTRFNGFIL